MIYCEGPSGELYRIVEANQTRTTRVYTDHGQMKTKTIPTSILVWNVYEHIAGDQMTLVKSFIIGREDSGYYQSEKQEALERVSDYIHRCNQ